MNQKVVAVAGPELAIGKVFDEVLVAATKVTVEIYSRFGVPAPVAGRYLSW